MGKLDGKVTLITGASKGLGAETARQFIEEGAKVVLTDIDPEGGQQLAKELGDRAIFIQLDVSSQEDWANAVKETEETFGPIDALVNNAGVGIYKSIEDITLEDVELTFKVDVIGVFLGIKAVYESMKKRRTGSIINISSVSGLRGAPTGTAYNSAKFAVTGMTKAVAADLGDYNVRVNSVHPGTFETDLAFQDDVADFVEQLSQTILLKRLGKTSEIAKAIVFLASDDSSYMTGSEVVVDGGMISDL